MKAGSPEAQSRDRAPAVVAIAALAALLIAAAVYAPLLGRPHEVTELAYFIPLLRESASQFDAFSMIAEIGRSDGRLNLVAYWIVSSKWTLFHDEMVWWHLARFIEMLLVACLGWALLRSVGASRLGAGAGSALLLFSPAAAMSFMRMSIAEPTGTLLVLLLALLVIGRPRRLSARARMLLIGCVVLFIGFLKEVLLVTVPVIAIAMVAWERGGLRPLSTLMRDPRLVTVLAAMLLASVPVAAVAIKASEGGYARYYGGEGISTASVLVPLLAPFLAFFPSDSSFGLPLVITLGVVVLLVSAGIAWLITERRYHGRAGLLLLTLGLPCAGALVFAAWPKYRLYYALPFQIAPALLLGIGVTQIFKGSMWLRGAVGAGLGVAAATMIGSAYGYVSVTDSMRSLTRDTAAWMGGLPATASVSVEVCGLPIEHFSQYAYFLKEYSISLGLPAPNTMDAPCRATAESVEADSWRVMLAEGSVIPHAPQSVRVYRFAKVGVGVPVVLRDSMIVAIWPPAS